MSDHSKSCRATNKKGQPCRAAATDTGFCHFHANPQLAAELGRAGGRGNRHVVEGAATPLPPLDSSSGVMVAIAQMIVDVHARKLHPRISSGVAPLLNTLLKGLETREEWERIKRLEDKISQLETAAKAASLSSAATDTA